MKVSTCFMSLGNTPPPKKKKNSPQRFASSLPLGNAPPPSHGSNHGNFSKVILFNFFFCLLAREICGEYEGIIMKKYVKTMENMKRYVENMQKIYENEKDFEPSPSK